MRRRKTPVMMRNTHCGEPTRLYSWLIWNTIPLAEQRLAELRWEPNPPIELEQEQDSPPVPTSLSGIHAMVEQLAEECDDPEEMEQLLSLMEMLSSLQNG